jgi:hypothetical protein
VERRSAREEVQVIHAINILVLFAALLAACVRHDEPDTMLDASAAVGADAAVDSTSIDSPIAIAPCTGCYTVIAVDAWFPPTRSDGSPWDSDGSLPEPQMEVLFNYQLIGATTALTEAQLIAYQINGQAGWRSLWAQPVSTTPIVDGDRFELRVVDATDHYLISSCAFKLTAPTENVGITCPDTKSTIHIITPGM